MSTKDLIIELDNFKIHHGKLSNRVYMMGYLCKDNFKLLANLDSLAHHHNYSKIIIKASPGQAQFLNEQGYVQEGEIFNYSHGNESAIFMTKYLDKSRKHPGNSKKIGQVFQELANLSPDQLGSLNEAYQIKSIGVESIPGMIAIFKQVFKTYPFDIYDPEFLKKTINDGCRYFGAFHNGELIGVANCEISHQEKVAEMTDFAILAGHRGKRIARHLLSCMEKEMKRAQINTVYTIARSVSLPMNATFKKAGYDFGGTLVNNTHIAGSIESMNIWSKTL